MVDYPSGKKRQLTAGSGTEYAPVVARDGRILYGTFTHQTDIYIDDLQGGQVRLTHDTHDNFFPRFSPDGGRVAYMSSRPDGSEIWIIELGDGSEHQLIAGKGHDRDPDWSPDGREIAFLSDRDGERGVWVVGVDGGAARKLCTKKSAGIPRWTPDGSQVGFIESSGPERVLWVVDRQGGEPRQVLDGVADFDWYRDGRHVIYTTSGGESPGEMRAANLETGEERVLVKEPHRELRVAPDAKSVSYCSAISHFNMNLHVLQLHLPTTPDGLPQPAGEPIQVTHGKGEWHVHNGGWSPDGKRVVYTRDTDTGDLYILDGAFAE